MVPQWDLLNLLAEAAAEEPSFTLRMSCEATGLVRDGDKVALMGIGSGLNCLMLALEW